jgi:nitric oxide dioxygenase
VHAFRNAVDTRAARHPQLKRFYCYEEAGPADTPHVVGRLDDSRLAAWLPAPGAEVDAYFLGPQPFMRQVRASLRALGVPDARSRFEFFGPASALE